MDETREERNRRLNREYQKRYYLANKGGRVAPVAGTVRVMVTLRILPEMADYLETKSNRAGYITELIAADMERQGV